MEELKISNCNIKNLNIFETILEDISRLTINKCFFKNKYFEEIYLDNLRVLNLNNNLLVKIP